MSSPSSNARASSVRNRLDAALWPSAARTQLGVQARPRRDRQRLGGRDRLSEPQRVGQQLDGIAAARRADVDDPVGDDRQHRADAFEIVGPGADEAEQPALGSRRRATSERGIDDGDPMTLRCGGGRPGRCRRGGAEVKPDCAGRHRCGHRLGHGRHLSWSGQDGDDDVGTSCDVLRLAGRHRAGSGAQFTAGTVHVGADDLEAVLDQPCADRQPHPSRARSARLGAQERRPSATIRAREPSHAADHTRRLLTSRTSVDAPTVAVGDNQDVGSSGNLRPGRRSSRPWWP